MEIKVKTVYLGLGSNINPQKNFLNAIDELRRRFEIVNLSSIWISTPVESVGPVYLNGAAEITTNYSLIELKTSLRGIERNLGRVRTADKNAPRTIDIDILIYDGEILDSEVWVYAYLAIPLSEIHPTLVNIKTGESIQIIADRLRRLSKITILGEIPDE